MIIIPHEETKITKDVLKQNYESNTDSICIELTTPWNYTSYAHCNCLLDDRLEDPEDIVCEVEYYPIQLENGQLTLIAKLTDIEFLN